MQKRKIDITDCANDIIKALPEGCLLTTKAGEKLNSMVIGWGNPGRIWGRPMFVCYVRLSRYTKELLDMNPEFTVNAPIGKADPTALKICGTLSGRDLDKIAASRLTPVEANVISVPGFKEFPVTLECKVVYRQEMDESALDEKLRSRFYGDAHDIHVILAGEIVDAYVIEE